MDRQILMEEKTDTLWEFSMKSFQKHFMGESGDQTYALIEHTSFEWKKLTANRTELNG